MTFDDWREYMIEMRALSTYTEGREVLVGLSLEETQEFFALLTAFTRSQSGRSALGDEYLTLDLGEFARYSAISAGDLFCTHMGIFRLEDVLARSAE